MMFAINNNAFNNQQESFKLMQDETPAQEELLSSSIIPIEIKYHASNANAYGISQS
jgi:hypothetical protein